MTRKRIIERCARMTIERLCDLAHILSNDAYAIGPQDGSDIIEALLELVDRRYTERIVQSMSIGDERSMA